MQIKNLLKGIFFQQIIITPFPFLQNYILQQKKRSQTTPSVSTYFYLFFKLFRNKTAVFAKYLKSKQLLNSLSTNFILQNL